MNRAASMESPTREQPLVSVVIPSHGMGRFVGQALQSVGAQSYKNWEVLLIDDCGPDDGTHEVVAGFGRAHPDKRVEYIRNASNLGCGASRNVAFEAARGDCFALLDADDYWHEEYLVSQVEVIRAKDLSFTRARSVDLEGNDLGSHPGTRMPELEKGFPATLYDENYLLPSTTMFLRSVWKKVGGFSREYSAAADWDYYLRCIAAGMRFGFVPRELCFYRRHAGALTSNYIGITEACVGVLRRNWKRSGGAIRAALEKSLYTHLVRLSYLRISFRDWSGLSSAIEAARLRPFSDELYSSIFKACRNNWKNLRSPSQTEKCLT